MKIELFPLLTEKSLRLAADSNTYAFATYAQVSVQELAKAIGAKYSVDIEGVNSTNRLGKTKRVGNRNSYKRKDYRVVYVRLKAGQTIAEFNLNEDGKAKETNKDSKANK